MGVGSVIEARKAYMNAGLLPFILPAFEDPAFAPLMGGVELYARMPCDAMHMVRRGCGGDMANIQVYGNVVWQSFMAILYCHIFFSFQISEGLFKRAFYILYHLLVREHGKELSNPATGLSTWKANSTVRRAELEVIKRLFLLFWVGVPSVLMQCVSLMQADHVLLHFLRWEACNACVHWRDLSEATPQFHRRRGESPPAADA